MDDLRLLTYNYTPHTNKKHIFRTCSSMNYSSSLELRNNENYVYHTNFLITNFYSLNHQTTIFAKLPKQVIMKHIYTLKVFFITVCSLVLHTSIDAQNYNMSNNPITDCNGFFMDSGGDNNYGANENLTTTICPDGSSGTHIRLTFSGVILGDANDALCFFDGEDTSAPMLSCSSDFFPNTPFIIQATAANTSGCVTVTFNSDGSNQAEGWSASIECVASCQQIEAILVTTDPPVEPIDTGWIDVCPMQTVTFEAMGNYPQNGVVYEHSDATSNFEWDFGDGAIAYGLIVNHQYAEPGGYVVQLKITDQQGCTNTNFISQRVRVSTRPTFDIGGDLPDQLCVGDTVSLNAVTGSFDPTMTVSTVPNEGSFSVQGVRSDSLALPDGTGVAYTTGISFTEFAPGQTLQDIDDLYGICVTMEHSWMRDLEITISCPDGTSVILHDHPCNCGSGVYLGEPVPGDGTNPSPGSGYDYCWTPDGTQTWLEWGDANDGFGIETLPPGDYASHENLQDLVGCPLNGEWTISVEDLWGQDNGFIFSWSIDFNPALYPAIETFTPNIVSGEWQNAPYIYYNDQDSIAASPQNAGNANFTYIVMDDFGCTYDTSLNVPVLPVTHPDCRSCTDNLVPPSDTTVCQGESVDLNVAPEGDSDIDVIFETFPLYSFGAANHPPANPYESELGINSVNPAIIVDPLTDIQSVCIDIETDWAADILVFLRAPNGSLLELTTENGGGGDNYTNTCFTPSATNPIADPANMPPYTGEFAPEGNWNTLVGAPTNGTWTLLVSDKFGPLDFGRLNSWTITFNSQNEVSYLWTPLTDISCPDCPNPTLAPSETTTYTVSATDSYGCLSTEEVEVQVLGDLSAPDVFCETTGDSQVTFTWEEVSGVQDYQVSINGGGFITPNNGNLSHTIDGLSFNDDVNIEVQAVSNSSSCSIAPGFGSCTYTVCAVELSIVGEPTHESCFGQDDGSVMLNATGGQSPYAYSLDGLSTQNDNTFTGITPGSHTVIVNDINACADTITFNIEAAEEIVTQLMGEDAQCFDGNDGTASIAANGGGGNFSYQWSNAMTTPDITGLTAGQYFVTTTDANSCEVIDSIVIGQPDSILLDLQSTPTLCANTTDGTASALASGGMGQLSYQWSNGLTGANISDLFAGTYCVTVTDGNGCMTSNCIEVESPNALMIDAITEVPVDCNGNNTGMAIVTASGGQTPYSYIWSDPLGQVADTAVFLSAGFYQVTVTDINDCQAVSGVQVTEPTQLQVNTATTDVSCFEGADGTATASPVGGTAPYTYSWDDDSGQTTEMATMLPFGNYEVTVTDANGCTTTGFGSVQQPAIAVSLFVEQTFVGCFGMGQGEARVTADGGTGTNYTYEWSNGDMTAVASNLDSISYTVSVTDENGCVAIGSIDIAEWEEMSITVAFTEPSCNGFADGSMAVNAIEGGTEFDHTYLWNINPPQTNFIINNLQGGQSYSVTVTDGGGCTASTTRFLPEPEAITAITETTDALCFNTNTGTASVINVEGGNAPYTYLWDANANNQATPTATDLVAGTYNVVVVDTSDCSITVQAVVEQPTPIETSFEITENLCAGGNDGVISISVTGGEPGYGYEWSTNETSAKIGSLFAGTYDVTVTDANGCEVVAMATLEDPEGITADLAADDITCFGGRDGSITISPQGGTPPYQFSVDNQFYNGASTIVGLTAQEYDVFVKDANDCLWFGETTVAEPAEFMVNIIPDFEELEVGDSMSLTASATNAAGMVEYVWTAPYAGVLLDNEGKSVVIKPDNTLFVELYGVDENGCEASILQEIRVTKTRIVEVPTGFTPNDDNTNDVLMVHGREGTMVRSFQVFDRWGEKMYEAFDFTINDANMGWDGKFKGEMMPTGAYVWFLEVEYIDGVTEIYKGSTTLIR